MGIYRNFVASPGKGGDVRKTGGAWYEPGKWDAVKKKRGPATIMIGLEFLDSKYGQKGTAGGTNRTSEKDMPMTAWFHEWVHFRQKTPILDMLDEDCYSGSKENFEFGDETPLSAAEDLVGYKTLKAEQYMAAAVDAESWYNEFDAAFKELCQFKFLCKIRRKDLSAGERSKAKKDMKDKLDKLCQKIDDNCKKYEDAKKTMQAALNDLDDQLTAQQRADCKDSGGDYDFSVERDKKEGGGTTTVTINTGKVQKHIDRWDADKKKKTQDTDSDGKTEKDKKKEKANAHITDC